MSDKSNNSSKNFLLGAVVGGIVGAVTALLLAPKSGKEMRTDLNQQASALKERSLELKDTAVERGSEWIAVAKEQSQQVASKVKGMTEQMKSENTGPLTNKNPFLEENTTTSSAKIEE
ncbi:YtxH domain-containing protein [Pueribacillus sp. YX66]|uniref:YtxH domain-containing protein n=1 Tax=Pueribacillus sp. YX66 TaxID=3229242 RepID=UPI00358D02F9